MPFRVLVDVIAVTHAAFIAYVVVGGFVAWRWPRTIGLHLLAASWGFGIILIGFDCPLTYAENWARQQAGVAELPATGFIDHYLTGVIYPDSALGLVRVLAAVTVLVSWLGYLRLHQRHRRMSSGAI
ncbi:DUF2784 domain-containing protein [Nocardia mangyaensis]|uniref:DUF2784 domain-containing protein n=1 Tax=Nocardia mangyaensis TaxID=2213200 RepID=UPI00267562AF|nr:DUF2784 domain-containing protein [Nocardia mangyaensis]MDO3646523.1 DUF2784 domain-containing protein [Nocardia mangyaensis]